MQIETPDPNPPPGKWAWLISAVAGLLTLALSMLMYNQFTEMERYGGSMRINWAFAILYRIFGKLGVVVPFVLIGCGLLWNAYRSVFDATGPHDSNG